MWKLIQHPRDRLVDAFFHPIAVAKYGYCDDCRPSVFDAGTLTLDMVDRRTNRVVWRGWAESTFDGIVDNQQWLERRVDEAVARMLEKFQLKPPFARGT